MEATTKEKLERQRKAEEKSEKERAEHWKRVLTKELINPNWWGTQEKRSNCQPMRNGRPYYRVSNVFCPWAKYRPAKGSINHKETDLIKKMHAATRARLSGE